MGVRGVLRRVSIMVWGCGENVEQDPGIAVSWNLKGRYNDSAETFYANHHIIMPKAVIASVPLTVKRGIKGLLSLILACLIRFAVDHPLLKAWALTCVHRYPALRSWLYRFAVARGIIGGTSVQIYSELSSLTPSARCIYADLKAAIERHNLMRVNDARRH